MKRFLIIFGICFGSLIVFLGGYLGVKYLIGDFDPEIILPENIVFEQSEYYLEDGQNSTITIITTTEGVTEKEVSLTLSKNCRETSDKKHWTDGVIIIPKVAEIGEPFSVEIVKDDTYSSELSDAALSNWVVGGISKIIATSKNDLIRPAITTAYVDVPVYKTEVVLFDKTIQSNLDNAFAYIEHTDFISSAQNESSVVDINAGEKFYLGVKYYPSASAIRYSKLASTNMLIEYKQEILNKLTELNLSYLYEDLEAVFESSVDANSAIVAYKNFVKNSGSDAFNEYLEDLAENYYKNLKYFNIVEKNASQGSIEVGGRILGTNIYEYTATQNLGKVDFYSYAFKKSGQETIAFGLLQEGEDVLQMLEREYQEQNILKNTAYVNVVDVDVDTIELSGDVENFYAGTTHVIYANKNGVNTQAASHLGIRLSNSNIPNVNLESSIQNVGIRFEIKQAGSNYWVDAGDIIKLKNVDNYEKIKYSGDTYYRPYGNVKHWEIYAEDYVEGVFRVVVKYFVATTLEEDAVEYNVVTEIADSALPQFTMLTKEEQMVSWVDTSLVEMQIVDMVDVLKADGNTTAVQSNPEYDLESNIDIDAINENVYTTRKYFIYSSGEEDLTEYFDVEGNGVTYNLSNGNLKLYELPSSIIKLKNIEKVPSFTIHAIFMTIKTDIYGRPIMNGDKYTCVKYSAIKEGSLEEVSNKSFKFVKSLTKLTGEIEILDAGNADVVVRGEESKLLVAHNTQNILKVNVKCDALDEELFNATISSGNITVVAKTGIGSAENYIELGNTSLSKGVVSFNASTIKLSNPVDVSIYVVYTVNGNNYMFKATHTHEGIADPFDRFTIESNVNNSASFVIYQMAGGAVDYTSAIDMESVDYVEISTVYNDETGIDRVYKLYYKGETEGVEINGNQLFDENGNLHVLVKNFLNLVGNSENTYYMSDNSDVVLVDGGKRINYIGNGTAILSLYLEDDVTTVQDTIKIVVNNEGYISKYAFLHDGWAGSREFDQDNPYVSEVLTASINGVEGKTIYLSDAQTTAENNTALFAMWYMVSENSEKKLPLTVKLDQGSIENFKAITGIELDIDNLVLTDNITISKNIGESLSIQLIYEWENIVQKINVNITAVTSLSSFNVYDEAGEKVDAQNSVNSEYNVVSGYGYTFEAVINKDNSITPYYYLLSGGELEIINATSNKIKQIDGKFYFDDADGQKSYQICISNKPSTTPPTIGDLKYIIEFNVSTNIKVKDVIITNAYRIEKHADIYGSVVIDLTTIFERRIGSCEFISDFAKVKSDNGVASPQGANLTITISNVINTTSRSFTLSYAGYTLSEITIVITPFNFENAESTYVNRVAKYNGERAVILNIGDQVLSNRPVLLTSLFNNAKNVNMDTNSFAEYVLTANNTITAPANLLFVDTKCYVDVQDFNGNMIRYKLIVSQLVYPFINFEYFNENYTFKDLDVYKLFSSTSLDKEEMNEYYKTLGISASLDYNEFYGGGDIISLLGQSGDNRIFNFDAEANVSFGIYLVGDGNINDFVEYNSDEYTLTTKDIGREHISVQVVYRKTKGSYTYTIPAIIKISQSQKLSVVYPYDDRNVETINGYGTDDYDNVNMLKASSPFGNAIMEYVDFKKNGVAEIDLTSERFVISKLVEDENGNKTYRAEINVDDSQFEFKISKVYVKLSSVWTQINSENISNYAQISGNRITLIKGGAIAIRAKILVKVKNGGAENYYYVQAGELQSVDLYRYDVENSIATSFTYEDEITLNTGDVIAISRPNAETITSLKYKYYTIEENQQYIKFKVIGNESVYTIDETYLDRIIINRSPNLSKIYVVIYTMYGEVATITININAYYSVTKNIETIYSGTGLSIGQLVTIKDNYNNDDVTENAVLVDSLEQSSELYTIEDGKIKFVHSETDYNIEKLSFYVELADGETTYTYLCELENVQVYANITSLKPSGEISTPSAEPLTENNGNITIDAGLWENLFKFNDLTNAYGVSYRVIYNEPIEETELKDIDIPIGVLIGSSTIQVEFQVILNQEIVISALAKINIKSKYQLTINYPKANDSSTFNCEYIQVGAKVNFAENTFNNIKRFEFVDDENNNVEYRLTMRNSGGDVISAIEENTWDFETIPAGNYVIDIICDENGNVYGRYNITVVDDSPIVVNNAKLNEKTIYAGYGESNVFNYVDITLTLPNINLQHKQTFDVIAVLADNTEIKLADALYYNEQESVKSIRLAVPIATYTQGVSTNNIYVSYVIGDDAVEKILCTNVSIEQRISILYHGELVDEKYYENIIDLNTIAQTSDGKTYTYELVCNAPNVDSERARIHGSYAVELDFEITKGDEEIDLTLNANEYPAGLSLVELFELSDKFGKTFWYNHVGKIGVGQVDAKLVFEHTSTSASNPIVLEPVEVEGTDIICDYKIKALGASNNGTIVRLQLKYIVGMAEYSTFINIKVVSDLVVNVLNGDGNATPNSENNPLVLDVTGNYTFVNSSQTTNLNDLYYIWVYGKFDAVKENVAASMYKRASGITKISVNGVATDLATPIKTKDLVFNYNVAPTFGDKLVTLTFVDNYGYTFTYYVKLEARASVADVAVLQDSFYEGNIINVYNKNYDTSTQNGVVLDVRTSDNQLVNQQISIFSVQAFVGDVDVSTDIIYDYSYSAITINYPESIFWTRYGNGQSVTITLKIKICLEDNGELTETFEFSRSFSVRKKYELSIKEENTYVRDGVDFSIEQLVSVYDSERGTYLGEPILTPADTIKLDFAINSDYVVNGTFNYTNTEGVFIITTTGLAVGDLLNIAYQTDTGKFNELLESDTIKVTNSDNQVVDNPSQTDVIDTILEALDITYISQDNMFRIKLKVKAINKSTGEEVFGATDVDINRVSTQDQNGQTIYTYKSTNNNFVYLGENQEIFSDTRITKQAYNFEIYLMANVINGINDICIAKVGGTAEYDYANGLIQQKTIEGADNNPISIEIAQFKTIYILDVAAANDISVMFKITENKGTPAETTRLEMYNINTAEEIYYLEDDRYQDKYIELYTGAYVVNGAVYSIADVDDNEEDIKFAYYGLTEEFALTAKSLNSVSITNGETELSYCNLLSDGIWYNDGKVDYQKVNSVISGAFIYNVTNIATGTVDQTKVVDFTKEETIRVTLYYTGLDLSMAYVGNDEIKLIDVYISDNIVKTTTENGDFYSVKDGGLTLSLDIWSENIELIAGVGYSAIMAKYKEANFGFADKAENAGDTQETNADRLVFTLKSISGAGSGSLVKFNGTSLYLDKGFKLGEYFITVGVECKYPDGETGSNLKSREIAEIYLGFKVNEGVRPEA